MIKMKKMIVITKISTGEKVDNLNRRNIFKFFYSDYQDSYVDYSILFEKIMKKYKDAPLVKYKLTQADKNKIAQNPDAIQDIPRYVVKGFDTAVGEEFNGKLRDEFYNRFMDADDDIVRFINETNDKYKATIKFVI